MYKGNTYLCFGSLKRFSRDNYCSLRKDGILDVGGVIGYQYFDGCKCKIEIFEDDHDSLIDSSISIDFHSSIDDTKKNSLKYHSITPYYNNKSLILDSDTKGLDR